MASKSEHVRPDAKRILITDDHVVLRTGLRMLLETQPDLTVVGEASTAQEAITLAQQLQPEIVLMDLSLPDMSGIQATEAILQKLPNTRVIALTMHEDESYLRTFLGIGGAGYVLKRAADTQLFDAIRVVARGRTFVDPSLGGDLLQKQLAPHRPAQSRTSGESLLTARETEVLVLVARGFTNTEIGQQLQLSVKTVETYRSRLGEKLGLRSRPDIVRYALEMGLLRSEGSVR